VRCGALQSKAWSATLLLAALERDGVGSDDEPPPRTPNSA
jgi:hypothetical protein